MKKLITLLFLLPLIAVSQLPYSWTANTNPGWVSSNPSNNTLGWQNSITTVSTSGYNNGTGWLRYNNGQTTNYTSGTMNFTGCSTSSYVTVTVNLDINLETNWDYLYFQYSTNNGTTWTTLGTYTGNLGLINPNFIIPNTANRFRFQFTSDPSVNSYTVGFTTYIYFADVLGFSVTCPVFLPTDLVSLKGTKSPKGNKLTWIVESQVDCDYYTLERSSDGFDWEEINITNASNSHSYTVLDDSYRKRINYYRLSQTDTDGSKKIYENDLVSIDNTISELSIISITNLLGQAVNESYSGVVIVTYEDGSSVKKIQ